LKFSRKEKQVKLKDRKAGCQAYKAIYSAIALRLLRFSFCVLCVNSYFNRSACISIFTQRKISKEQNWIPKKTKLTEHYAH
jgi:hypothetical protein